MKRLLIAFVVIAACGVSRGQQDGSVAPENRTNAAPSRGFFPAGESLPTAGPDQLGQIGRDGGHPAVVQGTANVFGHGPYDLFLVPNRLFPFREFDENGVPVYDEPILVGGQPLNGTVVTDPKGEIYSLGAEGRKIRVCVFNRDTRSFDPFALSDDLNAPDEIGGGMAGLVDGAGKLHVYFSIGDGVEYRPPGDHHAAEYMPYDGAGFWRGGIPRRLLYVAQFDSLRMERTEHVGRVFEGPGEFLFGADGMDIVRLKENAPPSLMTSEKLGVLRCFEIDPSSRTVSRPRFVNNAEGVALRHPVINPNFKAIADPKTGRSNLIVGDTGRIWFYRFTGEFSSNGSPIYAPPSPVKAAEANLALGALPVISPGDVDADGLIDLIVGNDAGQLLFLKNIGARDRPAFDAPTPVEAGDCPLDIKAGYRGSIQGPGEAMWGYTCPTLVDWNGDGRRDVILNSILADYMVLLGRPSENGPAFTEPKPLYCDGLQLHLAWRSQPAITDWGAGGRLCIVALDEQNFLRRFWRIDDQNVERGELLRLQDGSPISANVDEAAGQTGRAKLVPFDWDEDGALDLIIGTSRGLSFPAGNGIYYPSSFGEEREAAVLLLRNVGTNRDPVFDEARLIEFEGRRIRLGTHSCSPVPVDLGRGVVDLLVAEETGSIKYYPHESLSISRPFD